MIEMLEDEIIHKFIEESNNTNDLSEEEEEDPDVYEETKRSNPSWIWKNPKSMSFNLRQDGSDIGIARIEVTLHNDSGSHSRNSILCGIYTIATCNIRPGYRVIPLLNPENGNAIENAFIFGKFMYTNRKAGNNHNNNS